MAEHPIKALRKARKLTYQKISTTIREANGGNGPSAELLAQYVGGFKRPGLRYANMIHITFPEISRDELLYFSNPHAA